MTDNWSDAIRTRPPPKKGNGGDPDGGSWSTLETDVLQLIIDLVQEHVEHFGTYPTVAQIREKLEHPGS